LVTGNFPISPPHVNSEYAVESELSGMRIKKGGGEMGNGPSKKAEDFSASSPTPVPRGLAVQSACDFTEAQPSLR
jgi:hypothetical protein